jgi:hypothetical protein
VGSRGGSQTSTLAQYHPTPPVSEQQKSFSRRSRLLLPARGEKVGMRGPLRRALVSKSKSAAPLPQPPRSESRRGPLTLGRFAASTSPRKRGEVKKNIVLATHPRPSFAHHHHAVPKIDSPPANKGGRSAERRNPTIGRAASTGVAADRCPGAAARQTGRARLPAPHRGSRPNALALALSPGRASRERAGASATRTISRA